MSNAMTNILQQSVAVNKPTVQTENEHLCSDSKVISLAEEIQTLKGKIAEINAVIKDREAELITICGAPEEGSAKFNTEKYVITTSVTMRRKITDAATLKKLAPTVVKTKEELDTRAFKKLATSNPRLYQQAVACIESKASNPAIKITEVENDDVQS